MGLLKPGLSSPIETTVQSYQGDVSPMLTWVVAWPDGLHSRTPLQVADQVAALKAQAAKVGQPSAALQQGGGGSSMAGALSKADRQYEGLPSSMAVAILMGSRQLEGRPNTIWQGKRSNGQDSCTAAIAGDSKAE